MDTTASLDAVDSAHNDSLGANVPLEGLKITPTLCLEYVRDPFDAVEWTTRTAVNKEDGGFVLLKQNGCETPSIWSQLAVNVVGNKDFFGDPKSNYGLSDAEIPLECPPMVLHRQRVKEVFGANVDGSAPPSPTRAADVQAASLVINGNSTAPIAEPDKLPVVPETVDEQEDIFDTLEKMKGQGRWVPQADFLNPNINAQRNKCTLKSLRTYREERNVTWSKKRPAIGMDEAGNFLERYGKNRYNYRYWYFLLNEFDKQAPFLVPNGE
ncbi:MAG: hypothetical protein LBI05_01045 [Planctomycetaceae bacterium]|jgi:hypothetical protein|nr:hypothetical protein [Planctomycetaceae bacterium]